VSLQFVEARPLRERLRHSLHESQAWAVDPAVLRPLLSHHTKLTVFPKFLCGVDHGSAPFLQTFLLASEVAIPVNTMYVGRYTSLPKCDAPSVPIKVDAQEVLVFMPPASSRFAMSVEDWRSICREVGVLTVCSQELRERSDLPTPTVQAISPGMAYSTASNGSGVQALGFGWSIPEPWGVWSEGSVARLVVGFDGLFDKPMTLKVRARGLGVHPATTQTVSVVANGNPVATWELSENSVDEYKAPIPARLDPNQPMVIEFHIQHPISPRQDGFGADDRKLGFALSQFRFDPLLK